MKRDEDILSQDVSDFLALKYPKVIYRFDFAAGTRLSKTQRIRMKKLQGKWSRGYPDLIILKPNKRYCALFIELKIDTPYLKDGVTLKKDEHLQNQSNFIDALRNDGYHATFGVGLKHCIDIIDEYFDD